MRTAEFSSSPHRGSRHEKTLCTPLATALTAPLVDLSLSTGKNSPLFLAAQLYSARAIDPGLELVGSVGVH